MNLTALKKTLTALVLLNVILCTTLNAQRTEYLATFPGGVVYLPTINSNKVIVRYTFPFVREVTFYPFLDTLTAQRLDTCKREYIALSWAYDALERRYIDSTYLAKEKMDKIVVDNSKLVRKTKRKYGFRGVLWGTAIGIVGGVLAFTR